MLTFLLDRNNQKDDRNLMRSEVLNDSIQKQEQHGVQGRTMPSRHSYDDENVLEILHTTHKVPRKTSYTFCKKLLLPVAAAMAKRAPRAQQSQRNHKAAVTWTPLDAETETK
jgi:hypothetical protein